MDKHRCNAAAPALKSLCAALSILAAASASAHSLGGRSGGSVDRSVSRQIDRWSRHIQEASARFGIPEEWIGRVMRAESGGRTMIDGRPITSCAEAMGLMQLMPGTWAELRVAHGLGSDPHDPRDNILAGTAYLRTLYERFGYPGLFAAYNAGPSRYADYLATGRPLPAETIAYVATVGGTARGPIAARRSAPDAREPRTSAIFAVPGEERPAAAHTNPSASSSPIFVPLGTALSPAG